jgi:phage shock protein PspC (stress-responsive transcriptional regulator)
VTVSTDRARTASFGGLAAGLASSLGIDVAWVRLGWVVLAFATQGIAVLLYVALLFVVPEEPEGAEGAVETRRTRGCETSAKPDPSARPMAAGPVSPPLERWFGAGRDSPSAALPVGIVLLAAGAWILLQRFISIDLDFGWPVVAIVLGVVLVVAAARTGGRSR